MLFYLKRMAHGPAPSGLNISTVDIILLFTGSVLETFPSNIVQPERWLVTFL